MEWLFKKMLPYIDAQITIRIVTFHQALVARGQITAPPPQYGLQQMESGSSNDDK
jgi:hypothetical protein